MKVNHPIFGSRAIFIDILTAQKRSERLQEVAEAVSAITGDALQAMGAESFTDYARTVPGRDQIEYVLNWQFAAHLETTYPILQGDDGFARLDYQYAGSSWGNYNHLMDGTCDPGAEVQVTRLLNFKTGMRYRTWEFALSGTNILNQNPRQSIHPWALVTYAIPGRPRYVVIRPRTFA